MRIAAKSTKGKGKKWKHGSSSSSNPTIRKFRTLAKNVGSMQYGMDINRTRPEMETNSRSQLTQDMMEQHNAIQLQHLRLSENGDNNDMIGDNHAHDDDVQSVATFASVWSNCSNASFSKLLTHWKCSSPLQREMLAVLSAVADTIHSKGGKESETEYFAILMTTLENVEHDEALTAVMALMSMLLPRVPPSIIKLKFSETSQLFVSYLSRYVNSDNGVLVKSILKCIGTLLRHQESAVWQLRSTQQVYESLLATTIHNKPRIRKTAVKVVSGILKSGISFSTSQPTCHPAASLTGHFYITKLKEMNVNENMNLVLYIVCFMKDVLHVLPANHIRSSCEMLLRLMTLGNAIIVTNTFKVFHQLFSAQPDQHLLPPTLNAQIISALYDYQPNINDAQPLSAWLAVMKAAFINLHRLNSKLCFSHLPKLFNIVVACWLSDDSSVHSCVADTLMQIYSNCIESHFDELGEETCSKLYANLAIALKYQYSNAYESILKVIAHFMDQNMREMYKPILPTLSDMRDDVNCQHITQLDNTFSRAVQIFGPKYVIQTCRLEFSSGDHVSVSRKWLLPILRDNIRQAELSLFVNTFLPAAFKLEKKAKIFDSEGKLADAKTCHILVSQIWSLLPSFCLNPIDFKLVFKDIAKTFGTIISDSSQYQICILIALKNLIVKNSDDLEIKQELGRFAKNFIPILFNIYSTNPKEDNEIDNRLIVYELVEMYFTITDEKLLASLYSKVRERLKAAEAGNNDFLRWSLLDLVRAFIPYIKKSQVKELYELSLPLVNDLKNKSNQKKGYRIIEEICKCNSESCVAFMQESLDDVFDLLIKSLSNAVDSSKSPPLRSIKTIIEARKENMEELTQICNLFPSFMPTVIDSLMINSVSVKTSSKLLIISMANACKLVRKDGHLELIELVLPFLKTYSLKDEYISLSATVLALTHLFSEFRDDISINYQSKIIRGILTLMASNNRQVIQTSLDFLKGLLRSSTVELLSPHLELIVQCLTNMNENHRKHFRVASKEMLIKLIRKFGYEIISKLVPSSYTKILRSIRKLESRKLKKKEGIEKGRLALTENSKYEDINDILRDSDEENDMEEERNNSLVQERWIEESVGEDSEILDFTSRNAFKRVLHTDPNKQKNIKKEESFKVSDDGRLIIGNEDGNEKKRKRTDDEDESEIDEAEDEDEAESEDKLTTYESQSTGRYEHGGKGIHRKIDNKSWKGEVSKLTKGKGDIKKKGKLNPYAYIPLDRQALNKRKKATFKGSFKNVVKSAKIGAARGSKINKRDRKKQKLAK